MFIKVDAEGTVSANLLPLISFCSNSEKKSFISWLFNGFIFIECTKYSSDLYVADKFKMIWINDYTLENDNKNNS